MDAHVIGRVHLQLNSELAELLPTHAVNTHSCMGHIDLLNGSNTIQYHLLSKGMFGLKAGILYNNHQLKNYSYSYLFVHYLRFNFSFI